MSEDRNMTSPTAPRVSDISGTSENTYSSVQVNSDTVHTVQEGGEIGKYPKLPPRD